MFAKEQTFAEEEHMFAEELRDSIRWLLESVTDKRTFTKCEGCAVIHLITERVTAGLTSHPLQFRILMRSRVELGRIALVR